MPGKFYLGGAVFHFQQPDVSPMLPQPWPDILFQYFFDLSLDIFHKVFPLLISFYFLTPFSVNSENRIIRKKEDATAFSEPWH